MQPTGRSIPSPARALPAGDDQWNQGWCGRRHDSPQLMRKSFYESDRPEHTSWSLIVAVYGRGRSALMYDRTSRELGLAEQSASGRRPLEDVLDDPVVIAIEPARAGRPLPSDAGAPAHPAGGGLPW
jgi:hypothetical protein